MIKRLLFYVAAFAVSLVFASNAYAQDIDYKKGYFDLYKGDYILSGSSIIANTIDNNPIQNYATALNTSLIYDFNTPIDIKSFYLYAYRSGANALLTIEFYDDQDNLLDKYTRSFADNTAYEDYINFSLNKVSKVKLTSANNVRIGEIDFFIDEVFYKSVLDINADLTHNSALIKWTLPNNIKLIDHLKFDGVDIGKSVSYLYKDLKPSTTYSVAIDSVYKDGTVVTANYTFVTKPPPDLLPPDDVSDFKAIPDKTFVDLSWSLPLDDDYAKLLLYRDNVLIKTLTTDTTYKNEKLKEDTTYKYKIITVDKSGNKSDGKTITVLTKSNQDDLDPSKPDKIGDDWVINWTKPTTGQIKVLVGGTEYKIVNASDLKVVIPHADMIFDIWDNTDVQLIHIAADGTTQTPVIPPGGIGDINLGDTISVKNLLKVAMGLFALVASIVLLRMSFIVVPKLTKLIKNSYRGGAK